MYEGDMTECFPINETLLHSVQFGNKIYDTAPQCLRNSSVVMLCTYAYMDFATRMLLRQAPQAMSNQQPLHSMHRSLCEVAAEGQVDPIQTGEEPLYLQALVALLLTCQQEMVELQTVVNAAELLLF